MKRGIFNSFYCICLHRLQQHLPFTVYAEGCEAAEEQSDDEVRTSQVPEQSEGKTKVMKQQHLPPAVLKRFNLTVRNFTNKIELQQHLPLAVLKRLCKPYCCCYDCWLQQHLPLAVLKHSTMDFITPLGIISCNNTYRSRY